MWPAASVLCLLLALLSLALAAEQETGLIAIDQSSQVQAVGHGLTVDENHRRGGGGGGGKPGGGGGGGPKPGPPPNRPRPGPPSGGGGGGGRRGPPRIVISGNWKPRGDWKPPARPNWKPPARPSWKPPGDWKPPARPNWKPPGDWKPPNFKLPDWKPPARPNWKPPADWKPPEFKKPDWKPPAEWKRPDWKPPGDWKPPQNWRPPPDWRPRNNDDLKKFANLVQSFAANGGGALSQLFGGALFGNGPGGPPPSLPPPSAPPPIDNGPGPNAGWLDALKNNPYYQNSIDGTAAAANAIFGQPNPQPDNPLSDLAGEAAHFGNNGVQFQPQITDPNAINVPAQDPNAPQQQDPNQQTTTTYSNVGGDPNQPMSQAPSPSSLLQPGGDSNGVCATAFSACNTGNPGACCSQMCCSVGTSTTGSCLQSNDARDGFSCFVAQGSGLAQSKVAVPFYFKSKTGGK